MPSQRVLKQPDLAELAESADTATTEEATPEKELSVAAIRVIAMNMLARREHGAQELCTKLEAKEVPRLQARDVVRELTEEGLQSDRRFVEAWVRSRALRGKGPVIIRSELHQRAVAESLIEVGIEESEQDWYELAVDVRQRKYGSVVPKDYPTRAKQSRFLQGRGFTSEQIRAAFGQR